MGVIADIARSYNHRPWLYNPPVAPEQAHQ